MKVITAAFSLILFSFGAAAKECPPTPDYIKAAIDNHIQKIRAAEYCQARSSKSEGQITIAIYTAEGACEGISNTQAAGTCSNNWVRYMVGAINRKIIGPIRVGGKGDLTDSGMNIRGNTVELIGLTIGPSDPLCCPSVPKTKTFKFSQDGFSEIKP